MPMRMNTTETKALEQDIADPLANREEIIPIPDRQCVISAHCLGSECRWGVASSGQPEITEHA